MSKIYLNFSKEWIDEKKNRNLPIRKIEKYIRQLEYVKLISGSSYEIIVDTELMNHQRFLEDFQKYLENEYDETDVWSYVKVTTEDICVDPNRIVERNQKSLITEKYRALEGKCSELFRAIPMRYSSEMREYLDEVYSIIPFFLKIKEVSVFWQQNLLIAIDEGYGLDSFLNALITIYINQDLINPVSADKGIVRIHLENNEINDKGRYQAWDAVIEKLELLNINNHRSNEICPIVCIDISEWYTEIDNVKVRGYLKRIAELSSNYVCVFRIPFAEREMISDVYSSVSDLMSLRMLSVPPISIDNMVDYIVEKLIHFGYLNADQCRQEIEECIIFEKVDDNFLGYNTLDKIVNNIVYEHVLVNAKNGKKDLKLVPEIIAKLLGAEVNVKNPWEKMDSLIGLYDVKEQIKEIIAQIKTHDNMVAKGKSIDRPSIHMVFTGNPGTGKTTIARIVASLLKAEGILSKGHVHEVRGRDLCGRYIGETAPKTAAICRDAFGSVLFIDEAYSLYREDGSGRDYGREALDTLIAEMENNRSEFCVILAGYNDEMDELMKGNLGLRSRIPYTIDFPNYSSDELEEIFFNMVDGKFEYTYDFKDTVHKYFVNLPKDFIDRKEFGNARFVRNLFEKVWGKASYRCSLADKDDIILTSADFVSAAKAGELSQFEKKHRKIGFGFST